MRALFGFSLLPNADLEANLSVVAAAEEGGLDLVGVWDHPYAPSLVESFSLIAILLARTERHRFFPDVASPRSAAEQGTVDQVERFPKEFVPAARALAG